MNKKQILMDNLPEPYNVLAEYIDIDTVIEIAKRFGGERIYFPKLDTVERPLRNCRILEDFNGYNFKYLAKKYNLTETTIREICRDKINEARNAPITGQISFWE